MIPSCHELLWVFDLRKVQTITDEALEQGATLGKTAFSAAQRQAFKEAIEGLDIPPAVVMKFKFESQEDLKEGILSMFNNIFITL